MGGEQAEVGGLTLHLLDSSQGHPIQSWTFPAGGRIRIGRASDNDICLSDQRVSRLHAELVYCDADWVLYSHGRNGTWVNGTSVNEFRLSNQSIFQLGSNGPSIQVGTGDTSGASKPTINVAETSDLDFLVIDERRREEEVRQIIDSEAFQQLQRHAHLLKQNSED